MALIRVTRGIPRYNIQIGPMHEALAHNPSGILSVADSFDPAVAQYPMFQWVPILEIGKSWGYKPFFQVKRILDFYCLELKLPLVFVGCHAGKHRSVNSVFCWLLSLGMTPEQAEAEYYGSFAISPKAGYEKDIEKGYIPPDLPAFYKVMRDNPTWSYQGVTQSMDMYERITYESSGVVTLKYV